MSSASVFRFGAFELDVADRRLTRAGEPVELAPRAFDALSLLVREDGRLVPKARFFDEVWREVTVGDEALTQCIKTLRRQLGDEAANPRFILTVPKHGYRFVAEVSVDSPSTIDFTETDAPPAEPEASRDLPAPHGTPAPPAGPASHSVNPRNGIATTAALAAIAGAAAGLVGGLLYSILLVLPADADVGRTSLSAVLFALNALVGGLGGLGLGLGYGIAAAITPNRWVHVAAAALGGLAVGTVSRLLGIDAFNLVLGDGPVGITGGIEGAVLSGLVVLGFVAGSTERLQMALAGVGGSVAGAAIVAGGGRLMAGSLERIAETFAGSGTLAPLRPFLDNASFGFWPELLLGAFEGLVFGIAVGVGLVAARRRRPR